MVLCYYCYYYCCYYCYYYYDHYYINDYYYLSYFLISLVYSSLHECTSERFQRELSDVTPPCTRPMDVRRHRLVYFLVLVPVTTATVRPRHRLAEPLWHQRHVGNPLRLTAYRSRRPRGERNSTYCLHVSRQLHRVSCPMFSSEPRSAAGEDVSVCLWETSLVTEVRERETTWWTASLSALPPHKLNIWDLCCCC